MRILPPGAPLTAGPLTELQHEADWYFTAVHGKPLSGPF